MRFRVKRGLDVPVRGALDQAIDEGKRVESVALLGRDRDKVRDNPIDSLT